MVPSNALRRSGAWGSTQKQANMDKWMSNLGAGSSAKADRRNVQCSRCTQKQTCDLEAQLRVRQTWSGLEPASSGSCSVCPQSLIYLLVHTRLTIKSAANLDISEGTERIMRVPPTFPLIDISFRLDGSSLGSVWFLLSSVSSSTNSLLPAGKLCLQLTLA